MPSIRRRFTPPTCTLEIISPRSLLLPRRKHNWGKKWQFKLRFDDPREATTNQVTIKGASQELSKLQEAINLYLKKQLQASFQSLNQPQAIAKSRNNEPHLKSQGEVNHKLYLGTLPHDSDSDFIQLSTVQLFDLVTALAAFQAELASSSATQQDVLPVQKTLPYGRIIAAVAIAGLGITTLVLPRIRPSSIANSPATTAPSAAPIPELAEIIPPSIPDSSSQTLPPLKLPENLSSATRLLPPAAVNLPQPQPNIRNSVDLSPLEVTPPAETNADAQPPQIITNLVPSVSPEESESEKSEIVLQDNLQSGNPTTLLIPEEPIQPEAQIDSTSNISENLPLPVARTANKLSQLQEITAYFENQWQPSADLKQSLEYRLRLNTDGSIKKVIPLGKASRLYLSQTKIPVNGEPFISALSASQSSNIRLLLNPDGGIQAFIE
ncbi:MAG: DUF4335 domain-containing protein [Cyanobacteria bacterium J06621_8]